ncbi:VOC family protein [Thalassotalea euphylliae]|uniref:VOC family protein n=1 Tax=Thalassotalea euphylliae TaxID=1655234 RepID=A0A3E0UEE4_9GAMM|nr:VOC family protein [Thalassotalea euphylliae]REL35358.1 VOC family protein [Thalassotalea euphylliae]
MEPTQQDATKLSTSDLSIKQIAIAISDLPKALNFYHKVLNIPLAFEVPPNLAFLELGDIRLMLTTLQGSEQDHHTSVIYYQTTNIEQYFEQLNVKGVAIERPPAFAAKMPDHDLWIGFIRDPDENLIGIMEEKPPSDGE